MAGTLQPFRTMGKERAWGAAMIRLHVTAEGQTEQRFVKEVLCLHLGHHNVVASARCVLTSKDNRKAKEYRGGLVHYEKAKKDIQNWLKEDKSADCRFTTMFDLYALPENFPGYAEAMKQADKYERVTLLEQALKGDIGDTRFIPYIQLHEFEALLFCSNKGFEYYYDITIYNKTKEIVDSFANPEDINSSPQTAPSKRLLSIKPDYDKVIEGNLIVMEVGINSILEKCPRFKAWVKKLCEVVAK